MRVLVVDDEPRIQRALAMNLRARGYDVDLAVDGEDAVRRAGADDVDAVVLDLDLAGMDGTAVVRGIRSGSGAPIIVLTVRDEDGDRLSALDAGADDYVTKPFAIEDLLARLRATLPAPHEESRVVTGAFTVDLAATTVWRDGAEVPLTGPEWELLAALVRHPGRLLRVSSLEPLVAASAGGEATDLRSCMASLRRRLEPDPSQPRHLVTEPGVGYRFEP
jgi:two-component system, OmpR family, KDP operon response regulator KdpE